MAKESVSLFEIDSDALQELRVNKFKLDMECENNGNVYHRYSDLLVDAEYERDLVKAKIKEVEGKVALRIRYELSAKVVEGDRIIPTEYQDLKCTDSSVDALLNADVTVNAVRQQLILAERKVGKIAAVVKVFAQRKGMIEGEISLWLGNYYSKPDTQKQSAGEVSSRDYTKKLNEKEDV